MDNNVDEGRVFIRELAIACSVAVIFGLFVSGFGFLVSSGFFAERWSGDGGGVVVESVPVVTTSTIEVPPPSTVPPGEALLDGVGSAAGGLWGRATSDDAKESYRNAWESVKGGAGRVADSFSDAADTQRDLHSGS
jgi:hypothetical protein